MLSTESLSKYSFVQNVIMLSKVIIVKILHFSIYKSGNKGLICDHKKGENTKQNERFQYTFYHVEEKIQQCMIFCVLIYYFISYSITLYSFTYCIKPKALEPMFFEISMIKKQQ